MKTFQILLYYYYGELPDAEAVTEQQRELCAALGLTGRILISAEGINGTLEGETVATEQYVAALLSEPRFSRIQMKRSVGTGTAFAKLSVKYRREIVGAYLGDDDFNPSSFTAPYIYSEELHEWIHSGKEFYIVDMRNAYEHESGHFEGSVLPPMRHFRELPSLLPMLEHLKDKTVVTVCTGGVRCEKASGLLLKKDFKEVYQLYGGIVTYMETYPNEDFRGKLYVFDGRITMGFETDSPDHEVVGRCKHCGKPSEHYVNDDGDPARPHFICCEACAAERPLYASAHRAAALR
jgi:UPF0176 protein